MILKRITVLLMLSMVVWLAACKANVDLQMDEEYTYLTIFMSEEEAANGIEKALVKHLVIPQADLREGEVVVSGEVKDKETGKLIPGNLILRLWAENGDLQAKVTSLDFAGWDAQPQTLDKINQDIASGVARRAANKNNRSELTEVIVRDDEMSFTFKTPRKK